MVAPSGALRPRSSSCDLRKSSAVENPLCSDTNPPSSVSTSASSPCISRIWSASIPEMVDCVEVDDNVAAVDSFCSVRAIPMPTVAPMIIARITRFLLVNNVACS